MSQAEYYSSKPGKRRLAWIKANGPCILCGSTENLEIDHKNPQDKLYEPTIIWTLSTEREDERQAELAKCQVLCQKCHAEKTRLESIKPRIHGTWGCYQDGCRCASCMHAMRKYMKVRISNRPKTIPVGTRKHGDLYTYSRCGCRCQECLRAKREYQRAWYYRTMSKTGQGRRRPPKTSKMMPCKISLHTKARWVTRLLWGAHVDAKLHSKTP